MKFVKDSKTLWEDKISTGKIVQIRYHKSEKSFWILTTEALYSFSPSTNSFQKQLSGKDFTAFDFFNQKIIIGTANGYTEFDLESKKQIGETHTKLPHTELTTVETIGEKVWFGNDWREGLVWK
ncbi:MAG: hypothetical protein MUF45_09395 [Spirosomaceae bacterium]|nr:hypothetical protein [Spirosomataceae bacterium]